MVLHGLAAILCFLCSASPLAALPAVAPLYLTSYRRSNSLVEFFYDDEYYHLTVSVGTPAADFNLTLSNSRYGVEPGMGVGNVLFAKGYCNCGPCSEAELQPKRNEYDVTASSTAEVMSAQLAGGYPSLGDPYDDPICDEGDRAQVNGTRVKDVVTCL